MGSEINFTPTLLSWIRTRFNTTSSYTMLRDPNTLSFVQSYDTSGALRIPREIGNSQNIAAGATFDVPALLKRSTTIVPAARAMLGALQPIDFSLDRSVLTAYDGTAATPPISYQYGFGGIDQFRHLGDEMATSAGVNTQFTISHSITLPFGATLLDRYQRVTLRSWAQRFDSTEGIGDATQIIFPDIGLRWSFHLTAWSGSCLASTRTARIVETRQLLSMSGRVQSSFWRGR